MALFATFFLGVEADMYLHCPRGSNDRLNEENRERNNANRVFDSQNNNRGGYNVGQMYYYEGSTLSLQWTNQHSCNNPHNQCEIIIQYMCDDLLRDGTTTDTIPTNPNNCYNFNCDTDVRYGRHESLAYYMNCTYRSRNKGLFTSTQQLNGNSAIYTRQNPDGTRFGYECPEERDYYPYWGPSPWRDIVILTSQNENRCDAYLAQSQNQVDRWYCSVPNSYIKAMNYQQGIVPINQTNCEALTAIINGTHTTVGTWTRWPSWGLPLPACLASPWTRDNHLGNVEGGYQAMWNWTLPKLSTLLPNSNAESCVLRIRYNISTGDYLGFDAGAVTSSINASYNGHGSNGQGQTNPSSVPIWETYDLNAAAGYFRGYILENDPNVDIFGNLVGNTTDTNGNTVPRIRLQLAINTAQYGRTFQDRTHRFAIRPAVAPFAGNKIININVRGKRGNIVQVYPGTEYDFCPDNVFCTVGDYIHFQWTGSNLNPGNNAGEGLDGSDRHNAMVARPNNYYEFNMNASLGSPQTFGHWGNMYPDTLAAPFLGFDPIDLQHLAILDVPGGQFGGDMDQLDDAGTYFDLGPRQCKLQGTFHYLCTRNNNFSNRSQQGLIVVTNSVVVSATVTTSGASITQSSGLCSGCSVNVASGALQTQQNFVIEYFDSKSTANSACSGSTCASPIMEIQPAQLSLTSGSSIEVVLAYHPPAASFAALYASTSLTGPWKKIATCNPSSKTCSHATTQGGFYLVVSHVAVEAIVPVVLTVVLLAILGALWYKGMFCFSACRGPKAGKGVNQI